MRLGYVCTNYENASFTATAVRTLHEQRGEHEVHTVIVNNGASAGDLEALRAIERAHPRVEVLTGHGNVGYFAGLNLGIERLRRTAPQVAHLVVGNNDLEFPAGFMDGLEAHAAVFARWPVVSPDLVTPAGVHQNPLVRQPITRARQMVWRAYYTNHAVATVIAWLARATHRWTARPERVRGDEWSREAGPVIQGYGACYILGPLYFKHFDRLYAPTFLMQEEFFLGEQLRAVGQQVYYDPRFVVLHRDHAAFDRLPSRRIWEVSRDSWRALLAHRALPAERQVEVILRATGTRGGE